MAQNIFSHLSSGAEPSASSAPSLDEFLHCELQLRSRARAREINKRTNSDIISSKSQPPELHELLLLLVIGVGEGDDDHDHDEAGSGRGGVAS